MSDPDATEARSHLTAATRATAGVRAAGDWYPTYLVLMGALMVVLVLFNEVFFPDGTSRTVATTVWACAWVGLGWWAGGQTVVPRGGNRLSLTALAVSFAAYLFLVGPLVRWLADGSAAWWTVGALVLASPFVVAARLARRRA